jgi:uncharacterized damage-inducible protein DinB
MANSLQEFLTRATGKVAEDLVAALERVPADKRNWSAMGDARTALDQIAECAILNGSTADLIQTREWTMSGDFAEYERNKSELAKDEAAVKSLLSQNTAKAIAAIKDVPDSDINVEVTTPFGTMTLAQIMSYPYWNMCYHEGQINYIASMLGTLK